MYASKMLPNKTGQLNIEMDLNGQLKECVRTTGDSEANVVSCSAHQGLNFRVGLASFQFTCCADSKSKFGRLGFQKQGCDMTCIANMRLLLRLLLSCHETLRPFNGILMAINMQLNGHSKNN